MKRSGKIVRPRSVVQRNFIRTSEESVAETKRPLKKSKLFAFQFPRKWRAPSVPRTTLLIYIVKLTGLELTKNVDFLNIS